MQKRTKFGIGIGIIVVSMGFLAWLGYGESKTYYHTIAELKTLNGTARAHRLRVGGTVRFHDHQNWGRITALQAPSVFAFEWRGDDWDGGIVRWDLEPTSWASLAEDRTEKDQETTNDGGSPAGATNRRLEGGRSPPGGVRVQFS